MERERQIACEALRDAARVCGEVQAAMVEESTIEKRDRSPVTVADFAAQAIVCRHLAAAFPDDPIVGEESSAALRTPDNRLALDRVVHHMQRLVPDAGTDEILGWIDKGLGDSNRRFWTLDPIDGTKGFLRRGHYAIALALLVDGRVELGALACPQLPVDPNTPDGARGVLCIATRDGGAWATSLADPRSPMVPIRVDPATDATEARLVESVEAGHADQDTHQLIATRLGIQRPSLRLDSQTKYAAVARGEASIYLRLPSPRTPDYREKIWDHAAGMCVVEVAGGTVTDASGQPLDFTHGRRLEENRGVIATSGAYHDAVVRACAEVAAAG